MIYSGNGEELWIREQFPLDDLAEYTGWMVDIGAADGIETSNSLALEELGWKVLCIEANPAFEERLKSRRKMVEICAVGSEPSESADFHIHGDNLTCYSSLKPTKYHPVWFPEPDAKWSTVKVPVRTLDQLLEQYKFPKLDVLSIDTEGTDLDVLKGFDLGRWWPRCIISECWDPTGPVLTYLTERGYKRVARVQVNDLYLKA